MSTFNKVPYWLVVEYVLVKDGLSEAAVADRHAAIKAIREVQLLALHTLPSAHSVQQVRDFRAKTREEAGEDSDGFEIVEHGGRGGKVSLRDGSKRETISGGSA